jgi:hypothetical protein
VLGNDEKERSVQKWKLTGLQQERAVQIIEVEAHRLTLKTYLTDEEGYHMVLSLIVPNDFLCHFSCLFI